MLLWPWQVRSNAPRRLRRRNARHWICLWEPPPSSSNSASVVLLAFIALSFHQPPPTRQMVSQDAYSFLLRSEASPFNSIGGRSRLYRFAPPPPTTSARSRTPAAPSLPRNGWSAVRRRLGCGRRSGASVGHLLDITQRVRGLRDLLSLGARLLGNIGEEHVARIDRGDRRVAGRSTISGRPASG
jgi:hypothetical protein